MSKKTQNGKGYYISVFNDLYGVDHKIKSTILAIFLRIAISTITTDYTPLSLNYLLVNTGYAIPRDRSRSIQLNKTIAALEWLKESGYIEDYLDINNIPIDLHKTKPKELFIAKIVQDKWHVFTKQHTGKKISIDIIDLIRTKHSVNQYINQTTKIKISNIYLIYFYLVLNIIDPFGETNKSYIRKSVKEIMGELEIDYRAVDDTLKWLQQNGFIKYTALNRRPDTLNFYSPGRVFVINTENSDAILEDGINYWNYRTSVMFELKKGELLHNGK